jgi:hypothetical protein
MAPESPSIDEMRQRVAMLRRKREAMECAPTCDTVERSALVRAIEAGERQLSKMIEDDAKQRIGVEPPKPTPTPQAKEPPLSDGEALTLSLKVMAGKREKSSNMAYVGLIDHIVALTQKVSRNVSPTMALASTVAFILPAVLARLDKRVEELESRAGITRKYFADIDELEAEQERVAIMLRGAAE